MKHYTAGRVTVPSYDRTGSGLSVPGWIFADLLHRSQSDLGKESECGEYAAIGAAGSSGGVSAVGILRLILHDMETAVC